MSSLVRKSFDIDLDFLLKASSWSVPFEIQNKISEFQKGYRSRVLVGIDSWNFHAWPWQFSFFFSENFSLKRLLFENVEELFGCERAKTIKTSTADI